MKQRTQPQLAGIWRRLAALAYEAILLFAILFISGYLFVALAGRTPQGLLRWLFYAYLLVVCGTYFVFCWVRSGQTLAQKSWGVRVTDIDGSLLSLRKAAVRYLLAIASVGSGIGLLWAIVDRQHQFLHDRLAGSRLVIANRPAADQLP
jgi:uncharacterized RDD family membrane protein YckC